MISVQSLLRYQYSILIADCPSPTLSPIPCRGRGSAAYLVIEMTDGGPAKSGADLPYLFPSSVQDEGIGWAKELRPEDQSWHSAYGPDSGSLDTAVDDKQFTTPMTKDVTEPVAITGRGEGA